MFSFYLFATVHIFLQQSLAEIALPSCPNPYEENRLCGSKCPTSCDTLKTEVCCEVECVSGCFCRDGYILESRYGPKKCVLVKDCPKVGVLELENWTCTVVEGAKVAVVSVLRLNGSAGEISVPWHTVEGTARERSDFVPSNGTLTFPDGVVKGTIVVKIIDDSIKETGEYFFIALSDPTNYAEINARRFEGVRIIIEDDDMQPGYFAFPYTNFNIPENVGSLNVSISRLGGLDGTIKILYRTVDGSATAYSDYDPVQGIIVFENGQDRKIVQIDIIDDQLREKPEIFQLQLYSPTAEKNVYNFGQSASTTLTAAITILDDDMTPGYLKLADANLTVLENAGALSISVLRVGGLDGFIQIRYQTVDATALAHQDYSPIEGILTFADGQGNRTLQIDIADDNVLEPLENFQLQLYQPSVGQGVINFRQLSSTTLTTVINIIDNDANPGYAEISNTAITIPENIRYVTIIINRLGGEDGVLRVRYRTVKGSAVSPADYESQSGEVVFLNREVTKSVTIQIADDFIPEPLEYFLFELTSAVTELSTCETNCPKLVGDRHATVISIVDNDNTPGRLEIEFRSLTVDENAGVVNVSVVRFGGTSGQIRWRFKTVEGTAKAGYDYIPYEGELIFNDGEQLKNIPVTIIDDKGKEGIESFQLQIFDTGPLNFRDLGSNLAATIMIVDDDVSAGVFRFETYKIAVPENIGHVLIRIQRSHGFDGEVTILIRSTSRSAIENTDYTLPVKSVTFPNRIREVTVSMQILDDDVIEGDEEIILGLFSPTNGGTLADPSAISVIIKDNDAASIIRFARRSASVKEGENLSIFVVRENNLDRRVTVYWKTKDISTASGKDYAETVVTLLTFEPGEKEKRIEIITVDDSLYEDVETLEVILYNPSEGAVLGVLSKCSVEIVDNDKAITQSAYGFPDIPLPVQSVFFDRTTIRVNESEGEVDIPISRINGNGNFTVYILITAGTATKGKDFRAIGEAFLTFEKDLVQVTIGIDIFNDDEEEPDETFQVQLLKPSVGIVKQGYGTVTVTIVDDDYSAVDGRRAGPGTNLSPVQQKLYQSLVTQCPKSMTLKCESSCPPTCSARTGRMSCHTNNPKIGCIPACFCPDGLVKESETSTRCISPSQCPRAGVGLGVGVHLGIGGQNRGAAYDSDVPIAPIQQQKPAATVGASSECPEPLTYKHCANVCPPTCNNQFGKVPCIAKSSDCIKGCFCPEGLVKTSEHSHVCVTPAQCPKG